jgi:hypothetical protein
VAKACAMCSTLVKRLTLVGGADQWTEGFCAKCSIKFDQQQERLSGRSVRIGIKVDAFEWWMLKILAKKLQHPIGNLVTDLWNEGARITFSTHLGVFKLIPKSKKGRYS